MNPQLVVKVKYGETLRRFNVSGNDLNMDGLRAKIFYFFKFTPDADVTLTYIDEDNEVVTLVDDDDLRDAIAQHLNPLRINVLLNSNRAGSFDTRSSESSNHMRSPQIQNNPLSHLNSGVAEIMEILPEPLCDALTKVSHNLTSKDASSAKDLSVPGPLLYESLSKLSNDLVSKAASSAPAFRELVEWLSTSGLSNLDSVSNCQAGATLKKESNAPDSFVDDKVAVGPRVSKDSVATLEVQPNTRSHSGSSNMTKGVATSVPPSSASKDLDVSLSKDLNEDNSVPLVLESNEKSGKKLQKECVGHPNGKSIAADPSLPTFHDGLLMELIQQPSQLSEEFASLYAYGGSGFVDGDDKKKLPSGVGDSSSSPVGFVPYNSCPASGQMGIDACGAAPSGGSYRVHPFKRSHRHFDSMGRIFHKGVRCDGCGVFPITGPRFKSTVKDNYDLCSICFSEMGNEAEYTRMDRPMSYRSPRLSPPLFKEFQDPFLHPRFPWPSLPPVFPGNVVKPWRPKFDSRFIQDVNFMDGTEMAPATPFTKIWRMRNNGTIPWPYGIQLVCIGGDNFTDNGLVKLEIPLEGCPVDGELNIAADFTAPEVPGRYISYWRMALPSGQKFGQCVWVLIEVCTPPQDTLDTLSESFHGINLNLPPESSEVQNIDVNVEPVDGNHQPESLSSMTTELVKPMVDGYPSNEPNLPLNGSLFGNNGDSVPVVPDGGPTTVSYPLIDLSVVPPPEPFPAVGLPFSEEVEVEQTLLKELYEMGFKQIDLNKEILRMNEYNLEQSVEDLCGISEWDPILEELQEMGFSDKEKNKRLLMKNGGSIKRVVMDLIAGEKA